MPKNYYVILGIPSSSSQDDIKAAYRRLAKEFHPDYYGKNQAPFQVLQEAYSVLGNPQSRKSYDESLPSMESSQQPQHTAPVHRRCQETLEPLVPDDAPISPFRDAPERPFHHYRWTLDSIFDEFPGTFRERYRQANKPTDHVQIEIELSPGQARTGGKVRLLVPFSTRCPSCYRQGYFRYHHCRRCSGSGIIAGEKTVLLSYPPGIRENHTCQLFLQPSVTERISLTVVFRIARGEE